MIFYINTACASKSINRSGRIRSKHRFQNGKYWAQQRSVKDEELKPKRMHSLKILNLIWANIFIFNYQEHWTAFFFFKLIYSLCLYMQHGVICRHLQQWPNSFFTFRQLGTISQETWKKTDKMTRALSVCIMWQPSPVDLENSTPPIKLTITGRWRQTPLSDSQWHTQKYRKFLLNISKLSLTVTVTKHWHRLPREVVVSPFLDTVKPALDMVLGNVL